MRHWEVVMLLTPKQPDPATSILLLSTTVTINMTLSQISSQIQCSPLNIYQLNIPLQQSCYILLISSILYISANLVMNLYISTSWNLILLHWHTGSIVTMFDMTFSWATTYKNNFHNVLSRSQIRVLRPLIRNTVAGIVTLNIITQY